MNAWVDEWIYIYIYMDAWVDEWMYIYAWMDAWMADGYFTGQLVPQKGSTEHIVYIYVP
jgi:hypothetical protein